MAAPCDDCGDMLNDGEASNFTVCDACWDKHYNQRQTPTADLMNLAARTRDIATARTEIARLRTALAILIDIVAADRPGMDLSEYRRRLR
jgi:hypothetical protein